MPDDDLEDRWHLVVGPEDLALHVIDRVFPAEDEDEERFGEEAAEGHDAVCEKLQPERRPGDR